MSRDRALVLAPEKLILLAGVSRSCAGLEGQPDNEQASWQHPGEGSTAVRITAGL